MSTVKHRSGDLVKLYVHMTDSIVRDLLNVHLEPVNVYIKCLAKML